MDNNWIPIDKELPKSNGFYLIYPYSGGNDNDVFTAAWEKDHFEVWVDSPVEHVTHWQPLPAAPSAPSTIREIAIAEDELKGWVLKLNDAVVDDYGVEEVQAAIQSHIDNKEKL